MSLRFRTVLCKAHFNSDESKLSIVKSSLTWWRHTTSSTKTVLEPMVGTQIIQELMKGVIIIFPHHFLLLIAPTEWCFLFQKISHPPLQHRCYVPA